MDGTQPQRALTALIDEARGFLGLSIHEVQRVLGSAATPEPDDEYQGIQGLTSIEYLRVFPGTIYLQGGRVELVFLASSALAPYRESDVQALFGAAALRLRSRAGKQAHLLVYAEHGIACSVGQEELHFMEVFAPQTPRGYETRIYREPSPFIR